MGYEQSDKKIKDDSKLYTVLMAPKRFHRTIEQQLWLTENFVRH